ncbi:Aste57867_21225 [Aphanomyces stellatus]|uniref:Aste57867_21225 protein n=1 Tax=Aphanomyces stellatus TaxID=120398 RepID=A0A485LGY7_9STRA|nr:hypothetical protein As57867_021157 [Aphanomyces stellatus]VFT97897.1 Aste57867_21225 [Aphanomyces stellatus]
MDFTMAILPNTITSMFVSLNFAEWTKSVLRRVFEGAERVRNLESLTWPTNLTRLEFDTKYSYSISVQIPPTVTNLSLAAECLKETSSKNILEVAKPLPPSVQYLDITGSSSFAVEITNIVATGVRYLSLKGQASISNLKLSSNLTYVEFRPFSYASWTMDLSTYNALNNLTVQAVPSKSGWWTAFNNTENGVARFYSDGFYSLNMTTCNGGDLLPLWQNRIPNQTGWIVCVTQSAVNSTKDAASGGSGAAVGISLGAAAVFGLAIFLIMRRRQRHLTDALALQTENNAMPDFKLDKSRNVLMDEKKGTKLTDFGISKVDIQGTMTMGIGTFRWMAPEVFADEHYTTCADIYSFGCVLSEFSTHRIPYEDVNNPMNGDPMADTAIMVKVVAGNLKPSFREDCPTWIHDLALKCLAVNPDERPSAVQVAYELRTQLKEQGAFSI